MAENIPPGSAGKAAANNADRPGLPYYEKLRRDLRDTLAKETTTRPEHGCYRRPNLPAGDRLPRGNLRRRQHRQRLRQLHQSIRSLMHLPTLRAAQSLVALQVVAWAQADGRLQSTSKTEYSRKAP